MKKKDMIKMTKEEIILSLIQKNKTLEEIISFSGLSISEIKKVLNRLSNKGHSISRKYFYDGEIQYGIDNINNDYPIITSSISNELEFMVISDLHLGSIYENQRLLNTIYDYCAKNNIHIIINCGDLVEGDVNKLNIKIPPIKQLSHALRVYPISQDIINYLLLGNHDYSLLTKYQINLMDLIKERREDFIPIGYGEGKIFIKSDYIVIQHPLIEKSKPLGIYNKAVIIKGHGHAAKINYDSSNLIIYCPSLSKLNLYKSSFPGAIDLKIKMKRGIIEQVYIEELSFINSKMFTTNEINIHVGKNKCFKESNLILNEEEYPKILRKEIK